MLDAIIENAMLVITGTLVTCLMGMLVKLVSALKAIKEAVLAINHDRLYQACTFYILTDQITVQELRNLEYLYGGYHALGGNGTGTELYGKCKKLPIADKRTRWHEFYEGGI